LDAESAQARVARGACVFRPAVDTTRLRLFTIRDEAELRRQHRLRASPLQRATDQLFIDIGAVDIRGVEQIHAEVECAMDRRDRLLIVALRALTVALAHAHAAKSDRKKLRTVATEFAIHNCDASSGCHCLGATPNSDLNQ